MASNFLEADTEMLHVFDLPQLHNRPPAKALLDALDLLTSAPPSWECSDTEDSIEASELTDNHQTRLLQRRRPRSKVSPEGQTRYLTNIISSSLKWIENDSTKEEIWEQASLRLSERSGRSAMGAMSRHFQISTGRTTFSVEIYEPALTADNIGFKTWASSYLLSKRLHHIELPTLPNTVPMRILELGSGTGLVGISAAAVYGVPVYLTDLPEIVPNLAHNAEANQGVIEANGGSTTTAILDWTQPDILHIGSQLDQQTTGCNNTYSITNISKFPVIVAADSLYSSEHPRMLVQTIERWLLRSNEARVIVELPLRDGYSSELADFRERMCSIGLSILEQGEEIGYDDWGWNDERSQEDQHVRCWWSVWTWKNGANGK